nr:sensor histidine kinase [Blastococcus saxobsidens]
MLRPLWAEPRPPGAPARAWWDWVLVALGLTGALLEGILRPDLPSRWVQVVVVAAVVPLLLWRRTRPLLVLVVHVVALDFLAVLTGDDDGMYTAVVVLLLAYAVVRWGSGREVMAAIPLLLVSAALSMVVGSTSAGDAIGGSAVLLTAVALGAAFRYRARARSRELDQVTLRERERLARDLHDTVAHHVSAIAISAQAGLATAATRPEAAAEALRLIEAEASSTLAEMRGMVRTLRSDGPAELAPVPRIRDVAQLTGNGGDGPPVDVEMVGDVDGVPSPVAAAVYRLAQESITNARRHARGPSRIEVRVVADDDWVHVRVADDGAATPAPREEDPGFGLRGMAERTHLLGGTFAAGPGPDGGWTVAAVLPRRGPA